MSSATTQPVANTYHIKEHPRLLSIQSFQSCMNVLVNLATRHVVHHSSQQQSQTIIHRPANCGISYYIYPTIIVIVVQQ